MQVRDARTRWARCTGLGRTTQMGAVALLVACQSAFVADPELTIQSVDGVRLGAKFAGAAVDELFLRDAPYSITLSEADPGSGLDFDGEQGLSSKGLGGLFLPLRLEARRLDVESVDRRDSSLRFVSTIDAEGNGVDVWCCKQNGRITVSDQHGVDLSLSLLYCNWIVIGNVVTDLKMPVDRINLQRGIFTGYYELCFYGTGNAFGSGYFRGKVEPRLAPP